jgi:hypothetical protein
MRGRGWVGWGGGGDRQEAMIYPHKKFQSNLDINLAYNYWSVGLSSSGFLPYILYTLNVYLGQVHSILNPLF